MAINTSTVKAGIMLVIGAMLTTLIGAELLPQAFDTWFNVSTSTWGSGTSALWPLIPLFVVITLILFYVGWAFDVFE